MFLECPKAELKGEANGGKLLIYGSQQWIRMIGKVLVLRTHVKLALCCFSAQSRSADPFQSESSKELDECCQKYMKFICSHPKSYLNISRFPTFRLSREKKISKLSEIDMTACGKKTIDAGKMFATIESISQGTLRAFGVEIVFNISAKCFPKTLREMESQHLLLVGCLFGREMESESRTFVDDQPTVGGKLPEI